MPPLPQMRKFGRTSCAKICVTLVPVAYPAHALFVPDADLLPLVCQVLASLEIVRLNGSGIGAVVPLSAARRGEVLVVARNLGHLE